METNGNSIYHGFRMFGAPKDFLLTNPNLTYDFSLLDEKDVTIWEYELEIRSEKTALYVHLESETMDFIYSDNFFSMPPNSARKIQFRRADSKKKDLHLTSDDIRDQIKIASLFNLLK
jgi:hypothetical protein